MANTLRIPKRKPLAERKLGTPCTKCDGWYQFDIRMNHDACVKCGHVDEQEISHKYPPFWIKGQLLNVRNNGNEYILTLLEEEFDPYRSERAVKFNDSIECQNFVSWWYSKEITDPRA